MQPSSNTFSPDSASPSAVIELPVAVGSETALAPDSVDFIQYSTNLQLIDEIAL